MNSDLFNQQAQVLYLLRNGLWRSAQVICHKLRQYFQRSSDPFFQFWRSFCYFKQGSVNEAINEIILIKNKKEFQYATSSALLYYSQKQRGVDRETIEICRNMQNEGRKTPNDRAFASTIYFYLLVDESAKAKEVTNLLSGAQAFNLIVKGWYQLLQTEDPRDNQAIFDLFTTMGDEFKQKPIEYLLGLIKAAEQVKNYPVCLDCINELMVAHRDFPFTDCERLRVYIMTQDWEKFYDAAQKIVYDDPINIFGLRAIAFYCVARKGDVQESLEKIDELFNAVQKQEEENIPLIIHLCQLLSRMCGRNTQILQVTLNQIIKCRKTHPLSGDLCLELAQETLMLEDYDKAYTIFQEAAALDDGRIEALAGMIQCKIQQGVIDDAEKQLEFVQEVQVSVGRTTEIAFLQALLECKKTEGTDSPSANSFIEETLKLHLTSSRQLIPSFEFYIKFNPDFIFTIAQMFLRSMSMNSMLAGKEPLTGPVAKGTKLLESMLKHAPGMMNAQLMVATGKLALGDQQEGLKAINKVLECDPKNEDAYILHALVSVRLKQLSQSLNSLNQAISNNFTIRENPLFMLVKGEVEYRTEDYKNAQITLEHAYELIKQTKAHKAAKSRLLSFGEKDKCQIQIMLAKVFAKNKKEKEAKQIMQRAIQQYQGTPQESLVMMANSEIAIESGDIKKAINILKAVKKGQANFLTSRVLLADIYLKYVKDRRNYTLCYVELIEAEPTAENYKLMGDALMRINDPQEAVIAYQKAYELNPSDDDIVRLIGYALTMTYDYKKAINYYEEALKKSFGRAELLVDLGRIYLRVNDLQKADSILQYEKFLTDDFAAPSLSTLKANSQGFVLVAKLLTKKQQTIYNQATKAEKEKDRDRLLKESADMIAKIRQAYESAVQTQILVIEKAKNEGANVAQEKEELGILHFEMAKYYYNFRDDKVKDSGFKAALVSLDEAAKLLPTHEGILQLQADTLYQLNDLLVCEQKLKILQKLYPKNDFANMMLSELILRQDDSEKQIASFVQLLMDKPNSFGTLSKVIDWYRKQNRIEETLPIIEQCLKSSQNPNEPGLCFCRGLYYKFKIMPKEALVQFNYAKRHPQYAEESLTHMIDLYLNPELDLLYSITEEQAKPVSPENLRACDALLRELQNRGTQQRYVVMQAYVLQMSGNAKSIEMAAQSLQQLLTKQNSKYVPAVLAFAINRFLMKKGTEGKNFLKMLAAEQMRQSGWEQEELERAWLLHADSFIAIQKYDQAEEFIRKCLKQNKACSKAEELLGLIKEKESMYVDAANSYEKAFKLTNQRNPVMGYRLAFNYLKAKRYTDAINICKVIMQINPQFPKLQTEIYSKAIQALRP